MITAQVAITQRIVCAQNVIRVAYYVMLKITAQNVPMTLQTQQNNTSL